MKDQEYMGGGIELGCCSSQGLSRRTGALGLAWPFRIMQTEARDSSPVPLGGTSGHGCVLALLRVKLPSAKGSS